MPPAGLAWLDYSEADQRRAREVIALFSQRESRDELGVGRIRDAMSDALFPGTSVILTRARYFLFIPWLFREGAKVVRKGSQLASWVDRNERDFIEVLRKGDDGRGLIGRDVGRAIRILPSSIYWNSLRRFGILRHDGTPAQTVGLSHVSRQLDDATEFIEHSDAVWSPSIPAPPKGFPNLAQCDFALTHDEATWLAERIDESVPESLLQFLVAKGARPTKDVQYAWDDPMVDGVEGRAYAALHEARRFSIAMLGAALLYNVLLAERAEELGLSRYEGLRDDFVARLDGWSHEVEASDIGRWDLNRLWELVSEQGRSANMRTRTFIADWVKFVQEGNASRLSDDVAARALITRQERLQKRSQARLQNDRLMHQWGGASGAGRLDFRWSVVKGLLEDIADGREDGLARS